MARVDLEIMIKNIVEEVMDKLNDNINGSLIPIGVSNRHIHISRRDLDILFGKEYELTKLKDLRQPGQYAAKETVTVIGPKGSFEKVRILGPIRKNTQIEISMTDGFALGIKAPIRESGKIEDTPGVIIKGPNGSLKINEGVIVALRHIHLPEDYAGRHGYKDGDMVSVMSSGLRKTTYHNVLLRVSDRYEPEMHIDIDEANASGMKNGDKVEIIKSIDD
jgi:putative phosphotransacetylase